MDTLKTCQNCGKPLTLDTALPLPAEVAQHFPNLEIMECLGRVGMDVVCKARQQLQDIEPMVALKNSPGLGLDGGKAL